MALAGLIDKNLGVNQMSTPGSTSGSSRLQVGQQVLRGKYRLIEGPLVSDDVSTSWKGRGEEDYKPYLIKVWPFEGDTPDPVKHALWLHELRILYRVSSSPGAEDSILVLRDSRLDRDARCFVMVAEAVPSAGYPPRGVQGRRLEGWVRATPPFPR